MQQKNGVENGIKEDDIEYLQYMEYEAFSKLIKSNNENAANYFSINAKGNLVCANVSYNATSVKYLGGDGKELSDDQIARIPKENQGESKKVWSVRETTPINYKKYIENYILKYGLLTDLLITTQNTDFCTELTALAFNSHITIVIRDELTLSYSKEEATYTDTKVTCDYVSYTVSGSKTIPGHETRSTIDSGSASSPSKIKPRVDCGWSASRAFFTTEDNTKIYNWNYSGKRYQLSYSSKGNWSLVTITNTPSTEKTLEEESGSNVFVKGGSNEEFGDYSEYNKWTYKIITESNGEGHIYKFDIAEIDTWFARYDRFKDGYGDVEPIKNASGDGEATQVHGEFVEEATQVINGTAEIEGKISGSGVLSGFVSNIEEKYKKKHRSR